MKRTALYLLAFPLLLVACKSKCLQDSGLHSTRDLTVKPYDEIKITGPIKVIMRQDSSFKLNIQADSNAIDLIKADVSGHELELKLDTEKFCGTDSVVISVGIGDLKKIDAKGAARIYTASVIIVNTLDINLSGTTQLNMDVNAMKLSTTTDGSAAINLTGQAGTHVIKSTGAIQLNAFAFTTGIYDLDLNGASNLKINALNELKIKASGASTIEYKGNPAKLEEKKTGVYKLQKVN